MNQNTSNYLEQIYKIVYEAILQAIAIEQPKEITRNKILDLIHEKGFTLDCHSFCAGELFSELLHNPMFEIAVRIRKAKINAEG